MPRRSHLLTAVSALALALALGPVAPAAAAAGAPTPVPAPTPRPKPSQSSPDRFRRQHLDWKPCEGGRCATLTVPLDHARPQGPTTRLALLKVPATDPARRRGSLVVDPGGPGLSGVAFARESGSYFGESVRAAYDVVGLDPRGVGGSTPLRCLDDAGMDSWMGLRTPGTAEQEQEFTAGQRSFAAACLHADPRLVPHMSTTDVARDLDILRAALGEERLDYFGASYGTLLGATYADLFPQHVGRMVLDGAMDPALGSEQRAAGQAAGFERALNSFLAAWVKDGGCPLGTTAPQARSRLEALLTEGAARPIDSQGVTPAGGLTDTWLRLAISTQLYDQGSWPQLRAGLTEALQGRGGSLMLLATMAVGRDMDGTYSSNLYQVIPAVDCLDHPTTPDPRHYRDLAETFARQWPVMGRAMAWGGYVCGAWPVRRPSLAHPVKAAGAAPIVVVGTTRDPATPYEQAVSLARQLDSGRLITRDGDGHTGYHRGSACVDQAVDAYLTQGTDPGRDLRCS
ncbi:alpha/beta hydrolase [Arsenicicoccus dermatophilus]|uniref:alpha/beta hydrolase n=1 Tax=Arsenicicoccus dermatophilus TaxID=1076331 RepID=UPI0038914818